MPWGVVLTSAAVGAAGIIGGALITSSGNKSAAKTAAQANTAATQTANDAIDKQIAATKEGIAEGDVYYGQTREQAQPGVQYLRNVIAAPTSLTPAQRAEREDLMRRVTNSSQVAGSALRGSGRSFVDAMRAIEGDFTNKALDANRARADSAALQFSTPYFNSLGNQAGAHATLGKDVGAAIAQQGANSGNALTASGQLAANSSAANGSLWGNTIGQLGSEIASQIKNSNTGNTPSNAGTYVGGGAYDGGVLPSVYITPKV